MSSEPCDSSHDLLRLEIAVKMPTAILMVNTIPNISAEKHKKIVSSPWSVVRSSWPVISGADFALDFPERDSKASLYGCVEFHPDFGFGFFAMKAELSRNCGF